MTKIEYEQQIAECHSGSECFIVAQQYIKALEEKTKLFNRNLLEHAIAGTTPNFEQLQHPLIKDLCSYSIFLKDWSWYRQGIKEQNEATLLKIIKLLIL